MASLIFSNFPVLLLLVAAKVYAQCETSIETNLAVATTLRDYNQFRASMDEIYSTASDVFTGATVYVWTTLEDSPEGSFTAYGVYDANALTSAGYEIITETAYITACITDGAATETGSLPPSPSGQVCTPHEDHWHCDDPEETGTKSSQATNTETDYSGCEPHGDHWHCPSGVSEPTEAPKFSVDITSKLSSIITETTSTAPVSSVTTASPTAQFQGSALRMQNSASSLLFACVGLVIPVVF